MFKEESTPRVTAKHGEAEDADMHDSVSRLLTFARSDQSKKRIRSVTELGKALNISSATLTNWKSRGVSKEGANMAEEVFGVSPLHVLKGAGPAASSAQLIASEPPPVYEASQLGSDALFIARHFDKITSRERRMVALAQCILVIDSELPGGLGGQAPAPATPAPAMSPIPAPARTPGSSAG
jgi:hypothetical protein